MSDIKKRRISPQYLWEKLSTVLVNFVESVFFKLGVFVARKPWTVILLSWLFIFVSCCGLLRFHIEKNPMKLWVPPESSFYQDTNWYIKNIGTGFRLQQTLITADNVLEPQILLKVYNVTNLINTIQVEYKNKNVSIEDVCYKVPIVNFFSNSDGFSDPTTWVSDEFYCSFLDTFKYVCLQYNILDLWNGNFQAIQNATKADIIKKINHQKTNPVTGHPTDYSKLLGGIKRDNNGEIISASSLLLTMYTVVDMAKVDMDEMGNLLGTEDWVTNELALWEQRFLEVMSLLSSNVQGMNIYYESGRSFGDISGQSMFHEMDKLFMSIALMFFYVIFGLSRCNWLEIKFTLASVGLLCVGMAYISAVSWCSILGISFGPVHSSLPFLLMGLGIDDMFVMNACWNNLSEKERKKSLPVKVGLMLKHAGVSIVITSFTDIVALLIGAITILPSLKSFCIYAAMGVFFIFCYSVTFYVAVFTLDILRMESNRNGVLFCIRHKKHIEISKTQTTFQKLFADFYKHIIFSIPGKAIVLIFTLVMTGFSVISILKLEQRFDPKWFIPENTYYKEFLNNYENFYPGEGHVAIILLGEMDYKNEFLELYTMTENFKKLPYVQNFDSWVESFHSYTNRTYNEDLFNTNAISDEKFAKYLSKFLFSPSGGRYQNNFKFSTPLQCGNPANNITASTIIFKFPRFKGPEEYLPAMNHVKSVVRTANITTGDGYRSVWSKAFANWVTDEIIATEVERNIELALVCVMICTIILITNLQMCFWIFLCVLLTITNVLGWMQRWGMTVDIVCCIGLELAIGLCVDYAAHVGHTFLTTKVGSRQERAFTTVTTIGTAVLLGGGSTFLSLSLLSLSNTYTFQSFFKIFLLVIIFGLFNGVVFLPVLLSLIGPVAYNSLDKQDNASETVELNGKKYSEKTSDSLVSKL